MNTLPKMKNTLIENNSVLEKHCQILEEHYQMLTDCLDKKRIHLLSDKEVKFLEEAQLKFRPLTSKQIKWLGSIWERVTING